MNIVSRTALAVVGGCLVVSFAWGQQAPPGYPNYPVRTAQAPAQGAPAGAYAQPAAPATPVAAPQPGQPGVVPGGRPPVAMMVGPMLPAWADKLPPAHQEYLQKLLVYWEFKSKQVNKFRCDFERWEFDLQFGPKGERNEPIAATYATGTLKYERPDKGSFKVEQLGFYTPPKQPGGQATYDARPNEFGDHWVCDGKSVFEYLPVQKILREAQLPPEMQGRAIANGPLPFMFGAEAEMLQRRYAMRVITPKEAKNEYWIEAWPRTRTDAENFRFVEVIISAEDYLPEAMQMHHPNGNRTVFKFKERKVNGALDEVLPFWNRAFIKPELPSGWKREVLPVAQPRPLPSGGPPGQPIPPGFSDPSALRPTGGLR